MKQAFLSSLAAHLVAEEGGRMEDVCILLPNRRSALFLRRYLAGLTENVEWMPQTFSISDFVDELSNYNAIDSLESLFILYEIYRSLRKDPEDLDEFFHWGEIMLGDFDEIDKYLVAPDMIFTNIADLKDLEEPLAGLSEEQMAFIRQFWEGFLEGAVTKEKEEFLQIWKNLPLLYHGLKEKLEKRGEAYQGMQYREIADAVSGVGLDLSKWGRMYIVGFNALNACELKLFRYLQRQGASFFWDYDLDYISDPGNEAGRFMRENLKSFPPSAGLEDFKSCLREKDVRIFELPTDVLQARMAGRILEEEEGSGIDELSDTAVILCDEGLLMPVLLAIPESIGELNITMGYPLSQTAFSGFINTLFRLHQNARINREDKLAFYHRDVRDVLLHPYMAGGSEETQHPMLGKMARLNMITVGREEFSGVQELAVFRKPGSASDLFSWLREVCLGLVNDFDREGEALLPQVHREFVLRFLSGLNRLEALLDGWQEPGIELLQGLIRKMMSSLRIPFEGEPLAGLQLMGILESRLLDFRHVLLLSMNEDLMPASHKGQSYIPYTLRLAFDMPRREDMDAIYAYYFARLLQRSEKVDLLYNSTSEGVRTGEMSRYLQQLMYRLGISPVQPVMEVVAREVSPIIPEHDEYVSRKLDRYLSAEGNERYLSPSALNTYLTCPLKYYLRYMAGIGEVDEVQEEIDAAGFGTVVHESMRVLYEELAGGQRGMITQEGLQKLLASDHASGILRKVFMEAHFKGAGKGRIEGRNIIIIKVMERYLMQIIRKDLELAPFEMLSSEETHVRELEIDIGGKAVSVRLGGKIDRVDRVHGKIRVIDYKTGNASTSFTSLDSLFDPELPSRNAAALQTLLYTWLLGKAYPEEAISPGLYVMRKLFDKSFDPLLSMGKGKQKEILTSTLHLEEEFLNRLKALLQRLFDPLTSFPQTENEKNCVFCDYTDLCRKNIFE